MICNNIEINKEGNLVFAGLDTVELAKKYGTPLYLMDENKIRENCKIYKRALKEYFGENSQVLYASKAASFKRLYEIVDSEDLGIDVVSSGEIYTALEAGIALEKAYFHGNNKTDFDIEYAMENNVGYFVVDNIEELDAIEAEASRRNISQKILLRLTPGIDTHTYEAVNTGRVDSKFGTAIETGQAEEIVKYSLTLKNIEVCGFHSHIGSQVFNSENYLMGSEIMLDFMADMHSKFGYETKELNIGGGYGVRYTEEDPIIDIDTNIKKVADFIHKKVEELSIKMPKIVMEPGRSLVGDSGMTLYTVGTVKTITGYKSYVSVDGGMTDNPRYALYGSAYSVMLANRAGEVADFKCSLVGRCCESGDIIQENIMLPKARRGDIVAVLTTGAYNYSMASNYNRLPRPPVVMIKDKKDYLAVRRESFEDLTRNDI